MGKWKAFIPTLLALVIASGGSLFLYKWLQSRTAPKETVKVASEAVPVVVTAADLPVGTKLKREMLRTSPYFKESLPAGYRSDPAAIEGRVTVLPLTQNEPVLEVQLAPESVTTGGVSAALKPGKRAIAVKGDKVIGISGFIQPGNRVDVFVVLTEPKTKTEVSKLVLENIPVLATGTEIQNNADGKPAPVDVYTLEVDPEQGEKLALAAAHGKLQFGLRNVIDTEPVLTEGATIPKTLASLSKTSRRAVKSEHTGVKTREVEPARFKVEEIKGSKVTEKALAY
jgi:pilus assembly protein CpaB